MSTRLACACGRRRCPSRPPQPFSSRRSCANHHLLEGGPPPQHSVISQVTPLFDPISDPIRTPVFLNSLRTESSRKIFEPTTSICIGCNSTSLPFSAGDALEYRK